MISEQARVKIADFGIAKATDEAQATTFLTATGTTIGTPTYMAPEQAMGQEVGPWTDLYAVGIIAFELLAGRPPFDSSGTPMAVLLRHVNEEPLALSALRPSADPRLSDWIAALLATDPADRAQSAATAWLAFEEIVLDRLGSRWRREAPLDARACGPRRRRRCSWPAATERDDRPVPIVPPERDDGLAPRPSCPRAAAGAAAAGAVARRSRGGSRRARRLARSLVLLMALAVAIAAALTIAPQGGGADVRRRANGDQAGPAARRRRATRSRTIRATTRRTARSRERSARLAGDLVGPDDRQHLRLVRLRGGRGAGSRATARARRPGAAGSGRGTARRAARRRRSSRRSAGSRIGSPRAMRWSRTCSAWSRNHSSCSSRLRSRSPRTRPSPRCSCASGRSRSSPRRRRAGSQP